jgi:hypothetical protein
MGIDTEDNEKVIFTWKIPITATTYAGAINFIVRFECTEDGKILYAWNTTPCDNVKVLDSIYNTEFIEEEYKNVIDEWYNEILNAKEKALEDINNSLENSGAEANAYTDAKVEELKQYVDSQVESSKSDAITSSNSYADGVSEGAQSAAITSSNTYTDDEIDKVMTWANGEIESSKTNAVTTSNSYTDTKIEDLKQYTDGQIKDANTYTDTKIEDVLIKNLTFGDNDVITVADNTIYKASEQISKLEIKYPTGDFICTVIFTIVSSGDITITLPESLYIGETPTFANGETWELNICNGIVVGGKIE